jgi:transposase
LYGFLPPYSPELNPVEMIWKHIRAKYFNNRIFDTPDDVEKQVEQIIERSVYLYSRNN